MSTGSSGAAGREFGQQGLAEVRPAPAAVLQQEQDQVSEPVQVGPVDDRPAAPLRLDQTRAGQDPEMRRQGVRRDRQMVGDVTRRQTVGFVAHEEAKRLQARRLGKSGESENRGFGFHISELVELWKYSTVLVAAKFKLALQQEGF